MPRSLKLTFADEGMKILPNEEVSGVEAEVQNTCLNLGTRRGSDPHYATRGTKLFTYALQGRLLNDLNLKHAGTFAAIDTAFFLAEEDPFTGHDPVTGITLQVEDVTFDRLTLNSIMETASGLRIGIDLTL